VSKAGAFLSSRVSSEPYPLILDQAVKASPGTNIIVFWPSVRDLGKKFVILTTGFAQPHRAVGTNSRNIVGGDAKFCVADDDLELERRHHEQQQHQQRQQCHHQDDHCSAATTATAAATTTTTAAAACCNIAEYSSPAEPACPKRTLEYKRSGAGSATNSRTARSGKHSAASVGRLRVAVHQRKGDGASEQAEGFGRSCGRETGGHSGSQTRIANHRSDFAVDFTVVVAEQLVRAGLLLPDARLRSVQSVVRWRSHRSSQDCRRAGQKNVSFFNQEIIARRVSSLSSLF
jgi:hypothetical protein